MRCNYKLFNIPIRTYSWWEKLLLPFGETITTCDITPEKHTYCKAKKLFGKLYMVKIWEEEPPKANGLRFDYIWIDESKRIKESK